MDLSKDFNNSTTIFLSSVYISTHYKYLYNYKYISKDLS